MPSLRTSVRPPYAAYLRVYEPLAAFREPERSYWQAYAAERRGPGAVAGATALDEARNRLADLISVPPTVVPERESQDAFVHEADGVVYLCPWRTRLRSWLALEELQGQLPRPLLDAVVPPVVREQAGADWERWRARNPDGRPWILTETWNVPMRWFLLFAADEREFAPAGWEPRADQDDAGRGDGSAAHDGPEGGSGEAGRSAADGPERGHDGAPGAGGTKSRGAGGQAADGPTAESAGADGTGADAAGPGKQPGGGQWRTAPVLRYRTPMAQARRRVARGYRVLKETLDEGPVVSGVEDVGRWLEEFHPRSLVELDYGGLVQVIPEDGLSSDSSVQEVADGIAALREGDGVRAGRSYRAMTERWRRVQELQYAN